MTFGVDGIVISNHGGRHPDGMPATFDVLWQRAPFAKGRIETSTDGEFGVDLTSLLQSAGARRPVLLRRSNPNLGPCGQYRLWRGVSRIG